MTLITSNSRLWFHFYGVVTYICDCIENESNPKCCGHWPTKFYEKAAKYKQNILRTQRNITLMPLLSFSFTAMSLSFLLNDKDLLIHFFQFRSDHTSHRYRYNQSLRHYWCPNEYNINIRIFSIQSTTKRLIITQYNKKSSTNIIRSIRGSFRWSLYDPWQQL